MAGKKGRSGRKPNETGRTMRAVALYIPMYEYDVSHFNSTSAKYKWIAEDWFRQFKRINGNKWQERVRQMISQWTRSYEQHNMWMCECSGRIKKWHFKHEGQCPRCDKVPLEIERYKTVAEVNKHVHAYDRKPVAPTRCGKCSDPLAEKETKHGILKYCKRCNRE